MSNSITKTQVRLPVATHDALKDYAAKTSTSMNETIVRLIDTGITSATVDDAAKAKALIDSALPDLSPQSLVEVAKFATYLKHTQ